MPGDLYELLGVSRDATAEEIKRAYRRLARQLHPDTNPDDPGAEARFKEVTVAYETLSDPQRRRQYDQFGAEGVGFGGPTGFGDGLNDIFDAFFGGGFAGQRGPSGPPRGTDLEVVTEIDFELAVFGGEHPITVRTAVACAVCQATGAAPGSVPTQCPDCEGVGQIRRVRQSILGQMVTAGPCNRCGATGRIIEQPCPECRGEGRVVQEKTYTVDIPAGVDTGSTLRLAGRGAVGPRGGGLGDLYVHVRVRAHPTFTREGYDLVHDLHLTAAQAALGAHVVFETLDGSEDLLIPKGTQTGRVFRLRGRGVHHVEGRRRGDIIVRAVVDTPTELTREQEELLRRFAAERGEEVAPADSGFFSRIKSAFK